MTCVVGIVEGDSVYIGADSAGVAGFDLTVRKDTKVFVREKIAFGFSGSFRFGQLLKYELRIPELEEGSDVFNYIVTKFVGAVRCCMANNGQLSTKNGVEAGCQFLIGIKGRLFCIESDYQVAESTLPYASIGVGSDYALGALDVLYSENPYCSPVDKIGRSLEASAKFSTAVSAPFNIVHTYG